MFRAPLLATYRSSLSMGNLENGGISGGIAGHASSSGSIPGRYAALHRGTPPFGVAVRVLLYTLSGEEKEIAYHPSGKPYLADDSASLSISHTKGYVAVVLGLPGREVGVDIEQYGERVRKVAHKFMREDEQPSVFRGTDTWSLLLHWSAKETMFKCLNASEVDFRGHMRILPFAVNESGVSPPKNIVRWRNAGSLFIIICFRILS